MLRCSLLVLSPSKEFFIVHCDGIRKLAQATATGVRMRPGRVYMMEFKVIFVIGIVVERIMDGNS